MNLKKFLDHILTETNILSDHDFSKPTCDWFPGTTVTNPPKKNRSGSDKKVIIFLVNKKCSNKVMFLML